MRVLVTGAAGFINGYLVPELLAAGHDVVGLDDFSKYGRLAKSYDDHPRYRFVEGDAKDVALVRDLAGDCDQVVAAAAMIGGISYFHEFAYDLLAENERILASTFDAALAAHRDGHLERIVVISSSMVYESAEVFPTPEGAQLTSPPPVSTYGFQKLASEYFAKGAWEQYELPYTIVRPFNCVGIGERRALRDTDIMSGNVKLALSHVVPDLVLKVLKGQDPLHILGEGNQIRHYTYGGDLAHGIRLAMESPAALNEDFNLSTATSTTVLELAERIWATVHGPDREFRVVSDPPFEHDVQLRVPDVRKAREILGFEATTSLDTMLDEVVLVDPGGARGRAPVTLAGTSRGGARGRAPVTPEVELSVVLPVYNEGEAVEPVLRALDAAIAAPHELIVVWDFDGDTTRPVVERLALDLPAVRGLRNDLGRGVLNAMKAGIASLPRFAPRAHRRLGLRRRHDPARRRAARSRLAGRARAPQRPRSRRAQCHEGRDRRRSRRVHRHLDGGWLR